MSWIENKMHVRSRKTMFDWWKKKWWPSPLFQIFINCLYFLFFIFLLNRTSSQYPLLVVKGNLCVLFCFGFFFWRGGWQQLKLDPLPQQVSYYIGTLGTSLFKDQAAVLKSSSAMTTALMSDILHCMKSLVWRLSSLH